MLEFEELMHDRAVAHGKKLAFMEVLSFLDIKAVREDVDKDIVSWLKESLDIAKKEYDYTNDKIQVVLKRGE